MSEKRNPYVVLGVDYGASSAAATRAFARKSRAVRADEASVYSMDDLTWALHQIEQVNTVPESALGVYRIPSHPDGFAPPPGQGLLSVHSPPLNRRTPPAAEADMKAVHQQVLHEALESLVSSWPRPALTIYGVTGLSDVPEEAVSSWDFGQHIRAESGGPPRKTERTATDSPVPKEFWADDRYSQALSSWDQRRRRKIIAVALGVVIGSILGLAMFEDRWYIMAVVLALTAGLLVGGLPQRKPKPEDFGNGPRAGR